MTACRSAHVPLTNWAGNVEFGAERVHYPASVQQVQDVVRKSHKLRVLGSRHSFNGIADSREAQVSLQQMNRVGSAW